MKMIFTDLDGTLLNSSSEISTINVEAIKKAQKHGVEVVVATGRAYFDVQEILKKAELSNLWVIAANGATIHDPNGQLRHSVPIDAHHVKEALQWLDANEFYYEVFAEHAIYTPNSGRELLAIEIDRVKSANKNVDEERLHHAAAKQYSQTGFAFVASYEDILNTNAELYNVLAFSFDDKKRKKGWDHFSKQHDMTLVSSADHNFELEHKDASKGNALTYVVKELGGSLQDTIAIGDSFNDVSMLQTAGKGIAMANAHAEIKALADDITLTNDENGVASVIEKVLETQLKAH